jgi:hypothetical protein
MKPSWIAKKLIDKFRAQPNMPVKAILGGVKDKWGVDVKNSKLYRAKVMQKKGFLEKWSSNTKCFGIIVKQSEKQILAVVYWWR